MIATLLRFYMGRLKAAAYLLRQELSPSRIYSRIACGVYNVYLYRTLSEHRRSYRETFENYKNG